MKYLTPGRQRASAILVLAMSCFPSYSNRSIGLPAVIVNADDPSVEYSGAWMITQDSQQRSFLVSESTGDTATLRFTGAQQPVRG